MPAITITALTIYWLIGLALILLRKDPQLEKTPAWITMLAFSFAAFSWLPMLAIERHKDLTYRSRALLVLLMISGTLSAGTISYTSTTIFDPSSTVTYKEMVGPSTGYPPVVQESSIDCTALSLSGCTLGSFSSFFEQVQIPDGKHLLSAQLQIFFYGAGMASSGMSVQSVTPVDQDLPFSAGTAGDHSTSRRIVFSDTPYSIGATDGLSFSATSSLLDYTSEVQSALDKNNGQLDPIVVTEILWFNFKTAQSAYGGVNSNTTFSDILGIKGGRMDTILKVTYSNPEPSVAVLCATGLLALLAIRLWTRKPLRA